MTTPGTVAKAASTASTNAPTVLFIVTLLIEVFRQMLAPSLIEGGLLLCCGEHVECQERWNARLRVKSRCWMKESDRLECEQVGDLTSARHARQPPSALTIVVECCDWSVTRRMSFWRGPEVSHGDPRPAEGPRESARA